MRSLWSNISQLWKAISHLGKGRVTLGAHGNERIQAPATHLVSNTPHCLPLYASGEERSPPSITSSLLCTFFIFFVISQQFMSHPIHLDTLLHLNTQFFFHSIETVRVTAYNLQRRGVGSQVETRRRDGYGEHEGWKSGGWSFVTSLEMSSGMKDAETWKRERDPNLWNWIRFLFVPSYPIHSRASH